jgi:hypothetical protein
MAPNPYENTQNNFSGTTTNPPANEYDTTQGNWSGTGGGGGGGGGNPYLNTQGNWSGTGGGGGNGGGDGYVPPTMDAIQDMMNTTMGNFASTWDAGPSMDEIQEMMNTTMGNWTPQGSPGPSMSDIESMMNTTMGNFNAGPSMDDIQAMMNTTMGNFNTGPSMEDIQNMMNTTMGNFSAGPSMSDIESMMNTTLGGYMTPEQVQAMMESTMGAQEPGSASSTVLGGDTNVNVDLGEGDNPGMSLVELSQFLGQDPSAYLSGLSSDDLANMDADGDGTVSQEELDAYAGNVYSYNAPDNQFGDSVTNLNQSVLDMLNDPFGENGIPAIANFMDDLSIRQDQADADVNQNLVNRGITDSSIADNMRMQHERNQNNEKAMLQTNLMQNIVPLYSQTGMGYEQLTDADRQQSLGDFFQFLDRQVAENRWTDQQSAQGLSLMLNALGMGTINPSMPAFNIPGGQPGAGQSIGNLLGNLGTAWLGAGGGQSWLGG